MNQGRYGKIPESHSVNLGIPRNNLRQASLLQLVNYVYTSEEVTVACHQVLLDYLLNMKFIFGLVDSLPRICDKDIAYLQ
jgi:hypothetical protein